MEKIPTALEIAQKHKDDYGGTFSQQYTESSVAAACIEFAKLHVQAALEQASYKAEVSGSFLSRTTSRNKPYVNSDSITEAYPLENIQ